MGDPTRALAASLQKIAKHPAKGLTRVALGQLTAWIAEDEAHDQAERAHSWLVGIAAQSKFGTPQDVAEALGQACADDQFRRYVRENLRAALEAIDHAAVAPLAALLALSLESPPEPRRYRAWCRFLEDLDADLAGAARSLAHALRHPTPANGIYDVLACINHPQVFLAVQSGIDNRQAPLENGMAGIDLVTRCVTRGIGRSLPGDRGFPPMVQAGMLLDPLESEMFRRVFPPIAASSFSRST